MANKQKAWRKEAAAINKRRAEGSKEATARQQAHTKVTIKAFPSWLFMGLMIRAGLYDPLPPVKPTDRKIPTTPYLRPADKSWFGKAWSSVKRLFNK